MPKSTTTCNAILALIYNATNWSTIADNTATTPITVISMALSTVTGAVGDTMATNEATYTNYARVTVARTTGGWTAPASRATSNAAQITFAQCGASGNTITSAKTGIAAGAAAVLHYGDLTAPITVSNLIQPVFAIGAMTITEA